MSEMKTEASYFSVRRGDVWRTIQATPLLQLDVDEAGNLLGIERIGGALDDTDLLRIVEVFMPVVVAARALLRLKDGPRNDAYQDAKPLAWDTLRTAVDALDAMTDRWTAETEELVARAIGDPGSFLQRGDDYRETIPRWGMRAVLTALADAGLLLPPGGETRQEWGVADVADHPDEVWPVESEDRARTRAARLNAVEAYPAARLYRRTITVHTGPWVAVSET